MAMNFDCVFSDLPNELLIEILQFCDGDDVINFAEAVSLKKADIWDVIDNSRLWTSVVISPDPDENFINEKFFGYLGKYTKHLKIEWQKTSNDRYITKSFLENLELRCSKLEKLSIVKCRTNKAVIKLSTFPKPLTCLKLFTDEWLTVHYNSKVKFLAPGLQGSYI